MVRKYKRKDTPVILYLRLLCIAGLLALLSNSSYSNANEKLIVGYFPFWAYYRDGQTLADVDVQKLSHLIYSTAILEEDGNVIPADAYTDLKNNIVLSDGSHVTGNYNAIKTIKSINKSLKVLLAVGGWGDFQYYSTVLSSPEKRAQFVHTVNDLLNKYDFDGIEIDWRYPVTGGYAENSKSPDDLINLEKLLIEFNKACNKCTVSMVLSEQSHNRHDWDYVSLSKYIDFFNLFSSKYSGQWGIRTGHIAPLHSDTTHPLPSISSVVDDLITQGLEPGKIIIRTAAEAVGWENVEDKNKGLHQAFDGISLGTWDEKNSGSTGLIAYREILNLEKKPEYRVQWDDEVKSSTLYNPTSKQFISYEGKKSLEFKLDFVLEHNLGGVSVWGISSDAEGEEGLISITYNKFHAWSATLYKIERALIRFGPWLSLITLIWFLTMVGYKYRSRSRAVALEKSAHKKISFALRALPQHLNQIIYLSITPPTTLIPKLSNEQQAALKTLAEKSVVAQNAFSDLTKGIGHLPSPSNNSTSSDSAKTNTSEESEADNPLLSLERFTHLISDTNNLEKMMETMFTFISSDFRVKGVALWNEGDLVEQFGNDTTAVEYDLKGELINLSNDRINALISNPELSGYQISLEFQSPLTAPEEAYFRGLGNQIIFARQQFRELAKQPQLLLELYEIAKRKDKLLYIKGEKGYSGIHAEDLKAPLFVFSRLRALRMYFPELLVQVHRSYLVNPNSVIKAVKKDSSFHLELKAETVPVARSFLSRIKSEYPDWFKN